MPCQIVTTQAGLFTANAVRVALAGVSVDAEVSSFCARVVVTQRYVNSESHPIEAVYAFPLDEGAAVCGFEAIIDGTLVVGEVKEREDAFRMYDDAIEKGHGAFLLDEERPDVFQASVGNLPPGKEVLIKLTYVTELPAAGNGLRFSIPTTVSPRYAPAEDQRGIGRPDSEALNPPVAWSVPYGLNLSVRLAMGGAITRIESPSHPVSVAMNGNSAAVTLAQRDTALDRDFVLSVECDGLDTPQAWIERDGNGSQAIAVAFVPKLGQETTSCDVTFVVDRSGSMEGSFDRGGAQRPPALPALDESRVHVQHRRVRQQVSSRCFPRVALTTRPALPKRASTSGRSKPTSGGRKSFRPCSSCWASRGSRAVHGRWSC